jgi:hypothetical protein
LIVGIGLMPKRQPVVEIIHPLVVESLRKKTPAERLQQAFGMWECAMTVMRSSIKRDHPDWSIEQVQQEIFRRVRRKELR